jgi:hypothetical protein
MSAILIGFSFTLRPDGSPGRCNEVIARRMYDRWMSSLDDNKPIMAVQWEIYDALEELGAPVEMLFPDETLVAKPPAFTRKDIGSRMKLIELLAAPGAPAGRLLLEELNRDPLWQRIPKAGGPGVSVDDLVEVLNCVLESRTFYQPFRNLLDLHDLHRPTKGLVGLEKREIPRSGPLGAQRLGRFQTMRINRLIIEEIIPEVTSLVVGPNESSTTFVHGPYECRNTVLSRGQYLNVEGVARGLLTTFSQQAAGLLDIKVYGHPEHRRWCESQTSKIATELNLKIGQIALAEEDPWSEGDKWDEHSAQIWCRSSENWSYYQAL